MLVPGTSHTAPWTIVVCKCLMMHGMLREVQIGPETLSTVSHGDGTHGLTLTSTLNNPTCVTGLTQAILSIHARPCHAGADRAGDCGVAVAGRRTAAAGGPASGAATGGRGSRVCDHAHPARRVQVRHSIHYVAFASVTLHTPVWHWVLVLSLPFPPLYSLQNRSPPLVAMLQVLGAARGAGLVPAARGLHRRRPAAGAGPHARGRRRWVGSCRSRGLCRLQLR